MNRIDRDANSTVQTESSQSPSESHVSLENVHGSISVPHHLAGFWKQWRAFVGPAILVSVGYMDPGNWGTGLQGGAQFKYGLLARAYLSRSKSSPKSSMKLIITTTADPAKPTKKATSSDRTKNSMKVCIGYEC